MGTAISAGDIVEYGVDSPGMTTEVETVPIVPTNSFIAVSFEHIDSSGELERDTQAHFNGAELSMSACWTDPGALCFAV